MSMYETARLNMIEHQLRPNKVTDERVLAAFNGIRRELFVPEKLRGIAYIDEDLPLGGGRYMMEPLVAARLIQAAALGRRDGARCRRRQRLRSGGDGDAGTCGGRSR